MPAEGVQIFSPSGHNSGAPYSHIASIPLSQTSRPIILAGQIGRDPATRNIPATLPEQVTIALKNVDACLAAVGADCSNIIQVRQYIADPDSEGNAARVEKHKAWMGGNSPPSTVLRVAGLATNEMLYEIEVTAVVDSQDLS